MKKAKDKIISFPLGIFLGFNRRWDGLSPVGQWGYWSHKNENYFLVFCWLTTCQIKTLSPMGIKTRKGADKWDKTDPGFGAYQQMVLYFEGLRRLHQHWSINSLISIILEIKKLVTKKVNLFSN